MKDIFQRTELLLGEDGMQKLNNSRVAVFGAGGVGGYCVEALARSGVGAIDIVDGDKFSLTNINRQLHATLKTLGRYKVEVVKERIADINPDCNVTARKTFFLPENAAEIDFSSFDYVVDAIDTVSGKLAIVENAKRAGVPVISAMGAGNKLDPAGFEITDIFKTDTCPLAKVMRRELRKRGIDSLTVVYSKEQPVYHEKIFEEGQKREIPGSVAFVPSVAGLILAGKVIRDLTEYGK